jgi:hypothetical protein
VDPFKSGERSISSALDLTFLQVFKLQAPIFSYVDPPFAPGYFSFDGDDSIESSGSGADNDAGI